MGRGGWGCTGHPAVPTPSLGRKSYQYLGRVARRELNVCLMSGNRHCERSDLSAVARRAKAEAIHSFFLLPDGLLRSARNDDLKDLRCARNDEFRTLPGCLKIESAMTAHLFQRRRQRLRKLVVSAVEPQRRHGDITRGE